MSATLLFDGGREGYHTFRIPALITAANGDMLAFCEGRRDGSGDSGSIDLLLKRSSDCGRMWSGPQLVATAPDMTCGNPCPVLDRDTGTILLPFCKNTSDGGEEKIMAGKAVRSVWITQSADHGTTWSDPVEITGQVKKNTWTWYATGPGHGLQLTCGRLIIPCDHITGVRFDKTDPFGSHLVYSDDHGKTWHIGAILSLPGNESCAIELDDGSVYMNCRTRKEHGVRSYGISCDRGLSFFEEGFHQELQEPALYQGGCQGSLLKAPVGPDGSNLFLFCNPAHNAARQRLAIHLGHKGCRAWEEAMVVNPGPSGYSDLALTNDGLIACLYEAGDQCYHERIELALFNREQISSGSKSVI